MKRTLLTLASSLLVAGSAFAMQPEIIEGVEMRAISPNAVWAAGALGDGVVYITNLATGKYWVHASSGLSHYAVGAGTSVSNIGVVVGSTMTDQAGYWENGKWYDLNTINPEFISNAVSITPDGNVICGGVGADKFSIEAENTMLLPAVWYRQEDGTYGDPVLLPHPTYDLTGRIPQYITARCISDDGKTVTGQIRDYTGFMMEPIVYQQDENGEWSYTLLGRELLNPDNVQFPEWPGELPDEVMMPSQEQFMTPEELDAFLAAFAEWNYGDYDQMPTYEEFMTPEEIAAYQEAYREYIEIAVPWQKKFDDFMDAYMYYAGTGAAFVFNNGRVSPDGKYYVSNADIVDGLRSGLRTVVFDTTDGSYQILESNLGALVNYVSADYTILAFTGLLGDDAGTVKTYVYPQMQTPPVLLEDYIADIDPDLAAWMEDNMYHEVITGLGTGDNRFNTVDMLCTGLAVATPDLSVFLSTNSTYSWYDYVGTEEYLSFLLPVNGGYNKVECIESVNDFSLSVLPGGVISLKGEFKNVDIFDLTGCRVYSASNASGNLSTGLNSGIYVVRAVNADGETLTRKVNMR